MHTDRALSRGSVNNSCPSFDKENVKADVLGSNIALSIGTEDKYSLGLTSIAKKCDKFERARLSVNNTLFRKQNKEIYGFIPLDGVSKVSVFRKYKVPMESLEAHKLLKNQDAPITRVSKYQL